MLDALKEIKHGVGAFQFNANLSLLASWYLFPSIFFSLAIFLPLSAIFYLSRFDVTKTDRLHALRRPFAKKKKQTDLPRELQEHNNQRRTNLFPVKR